MSGDNIYDLMLNGDSILDGIPDATEDAWDAVAAWVRRCAPDLAAPLLGDYQGATA